MKKTGTKAALGKSSARPTAVRKYVYAFLAVLAVAAAVALLI